MVVLNLELYEGKDYMKSKKGVKEHGATCATTLRLTEPWKGSGRVVIGDSWFGSVNTATQLFNINGRMQISSSKLHIETTPHISFNKKKLAVVDGPKQVV